MNYYDHLDWTEARLVAEAVGLNMLQQALEWRDEALIRDKTRYMSHILCYLLDNPQVLESLSGSNRAFVRDWMLRANRAYMTQEAAQCRRTKALWN